MNGTVHLLPLYAFLAWTEDFLGVSLFEVSAVRLPLLEKLHARCGFTVQNFQRVRLRILRFL